MERLSPEEMKREVLENEKVLREITGKKTKYFRFPGGNCDDSSLKLVERLGYKVVHWSFASGDPDRKMTPERLRDWVLYKSKPGSILIFHINGGGYHTGYALPDILKKLTNRGYGFVKLEDNLPD